jgi:N-acetylglutamate synthase-like GNAT family acetyltransferase
MPQLLERHREEFTISTDPSRLDVDAIADMLSRSYWANKRTHEQLERALSNSLVFGLFDGSHQIGLARIISDFAYLCDVIIHEEYRGQGLGKWLMETVHSHPDLQDLRRWFLATRDAHGLYSQYGWTPLNVPERWMEKFSG